MIIKQLNSFNPICFSKNFNSIKFFRQPLINLQQKQNQIRFYGRINNSSPLYYYNNNNNNKNNNKIDLSPEMIELIRYRLKSGSKLNYKFNYDTTKQISEAAVLMPLCVVKGEPSVLFTIRSMNLKTHTGEVRYRIKLV
ncbi:hypothetical protein C1645_774898 [Glomus cerebriforme]|uniref:Uncharacterized protein n=1 Tax=Glomus cerebriforme TaxID=658196 RepID=A0A397T045_9GLOM|nr:hypothetical protein C1645_774898 [Glomus cerebriforme]